MNLAILRPYIPGQADLGPFAAECALIATLVAILVTPFFAKRRNNATFLVALAGLTVALVAMLIYGVPENAGDRLPLRGILIADAFSMLWKAMLLIFTIGTLLLWRAVAADRTQEGDGPEYFTLIVGATLGMCLMASTTNLLMIFLALELASFPSYVLAGFRKTSRLGAEASLKYVLFGAASSGIMVYALTFLYGLYGTLDVATVAQRIAAVPAAGGAASAALLSVALFGLLVGIGFKLAAVPFHFWCPDVFEGASVEVSAFLSVASKGAALALLLRVMMTVAEALDYRAVQPLTGLAWTLGIVGAITATAGNVAAFVQTSVKRLLAYSSIAHAGYMLCAASLIVNHNARQTTGENNSPAQAILFYLAVYLFMNLAAFAVAGLVARGSAAGDHLSAFDGLARRNPVLAHSMLAAMISLIGLPPFAGFVAKLNVLLVLMNNGGGWWALVAVIAVNSIASAFYYFRVVRAMYVEPPTEGAFVSHPVGTALAVTSAVALVLMLVLASPINSLTRDYARIHGVSDHPAATTRPGVVTAAANP
jgi:NADH-quinone oxidoreductase subunit N